MHANHTSRILTICSILACALSAQADTPVKTGDIAPNITLRDMNGKMVFGKNILKEKPLLVSFFFTACKPCKKEIPELEKLHGKYNGRVKMFLIATDAEGEDAVRPYVEKMHISIDVLIDKYSDAVRQFGVTKYPSLYLIGKDGRVIYSCEGYSEDNIAALDGILGKFK
jgi:peroxiredoxin